mmetsp:Transcript_4061/g.7482  ORF Transcript_4061/g.7482 Transcript_4061/m.7482 type:complete len:173 (+) Transcript_4061:489-1007(+)|eukprot:CAMPEP_0197518172 /NCGR_PEP_ID=MMETSP1318-20131121/3303_1 /TAXON_ID=552666 /ORGANISM="Partenskyella glossopodia, Strain RCC365" /LENGTH=172 /DNA_ID=CAMNT_0043068289 /DNA_START=396 /DNA_END=914 /DNA_ORIENTATION=-
MKRGSVLAHGVELKPGEYFAVFIATIEPSKVEISGAGSDECNGTYTKVPKFINKYKNEKGCYLKRYVSDSGYVYHIDNDGKLGNVLYVETKRGLRGAPTDKWQVEKGKAPAPTAVRSSIPHKNRPHGFVVYADTRIEPSKANPLSGEDIEKAFYKSKQDKMNTALLRLNDPV